MSILSMDFVLKAWAEQMTEEDVTALDRIEYLVRMSILEHDKALGALLASSEKMTEVRTLAGTDEFDADDAARLDRQVGG